LLIFSWTNFGARIFCSAGMVTLALPNCQYEFK